MRLEVQITGDALKLKRAFGVRLTFWERLRYAFARGLAAWRRTA